MNIMTFLWSPGAACRSCRASRRTFTSPYGRTSPIHASCCTLFLTRTSAPLVVGCARMPRNTRDLCAHRGERGRAACRKTWRRGAKWTEIAGMSFWTWLLAAERSASSVEQTGGYCWPPPKYRNWYAQHAFFEGKKAEQTSPRKSTPRTLKGVGQQYPPGYCWSTPRRRLKHLSDVLPCFLYYNNNFCSIK